MDVSFIDVSPKSHPLVSPTTSHNHNCGEFTTRRTPLIAFAFGSLGKLHFWSSMLAFWGVSFIRHVCFLWRFKSDFYTAEWKNMFAFTTTIQVPIDCTQNANRKHIPNVAGSAQICQVMPHSSMLYPKNPDPFWLTSGPKHPKMVQTFCPTRILRVCTYYRRSWLKPPTLSKKLITFMNRSTWNLFVLYFGGWTLQKKTLSVQNKGHLGSICI